MVQVVVPETFSDNARIGQVAFEAKCAVCHGANAAGQDGVAPPLVHKIYEPSHHGDAAFLLAAKNGVRAHHWRFGNMPPVEGVTDPTGAGDCFAGGFMGYLAAAHEKDADVHLDSIQTALAHGTIIASFAIESFSLDRLASLTKQEVAKRYEEFSEMVQVRK